MPENNIEDERPGVGVPARVPQNLMANLNPNTAVINLVNYSRD